MAKVIDYSSGVEAIRVSRKKGSIAENRAKCDCQPEITKDGRTIHKRGCSYFNSLFYAIIANTSG